MSRGCCAILPLCGGRRLGRPVPAVAAFFESKDHLRGVIWAKNPEMFCTAVKTLTMKAERKVSVVS
jgi:hypothetical protein